MQGLGRRQLVEAFAKGPVADLVMVLQKQHKGAGRQVPAGFAAGLAMAVGMALEGETLAQAAGQLLSGLLGEVGVVGVGFAGQQHMQGVVAVVVPLCVEALLQQAGLIELVLQVEPHMAIGWHCLADPLRQLPQEIRIVDGVHRVQAQAVETVLQQPHQGVVDKELADLRAAKVDGSAPGGVQVLAKEALGVLLQVVAVGAEVVVDHIEDHCQAQAMGGIDQRAQLVGRTIGGFRGVGQHAVVAPVAFTGKLRQGHQLDGGHPQFTRPAGLAAPPDSRP